MRIKIDKCYNCLCNACSRFNCPYVTSRCNVCYNNGFRMCHDCDYWESNKTAPKRFRIVRRVRGRQDSINIKLDFIIANMGLNKPIINTDGTYDVIRKGTTIARFYNLQEAESFIERFQSEFKSKLTIKTVKLDL